MLCFMSILFLQMSRLERERELFALPLCLSGVFYCCMALPQGAKGLSSVCDCDIS